MTTGPKEETNPIPKYVIDEEGYKHFLIEKIGQGGQGAVFKTNDENVVIKVVLADDGNILQDQAKYKAFKDEIDEVRILDIPENLHIAKPIHMLKSPYNGYLMRLLSDMVPIKQIMITPKEEGLKEFYLRTGGLKRRLKLLANTAKIFARIHAMPIVYADISPDNIFISKNLDAIEVWLIDADNMRYTMDFSRPIFTPGYGAPEVFKGVTSNNTYSDVYSFAILAFELLSLVPPFEGELLLNGDGWDEDNWDIKDEWSENESLSSEMDNYKKADRGEVPWIEDEDDKRNFNNNGIPREIVLSKRMYQLFQQTFGEQGRKDPTSRPTMKQWYEALQQAADATVNCSHCRGAFYIGTNSCPFCNKTRERVYLGQVYDEYFLENILEDINDESYINLKMETPKEIQYQKLKFKLIDQNYSTHYFYNYQTDDILIRDVIEEAIEITIGRVTTIKNLMEKEIKIISGNMELIMKKYDVFDCPNLENVHIQFDMNNVKMRKISFRLI